MAVSRVLVAVAIALLATMYFADRDIRAQTQSPPSSTAPVRTETITYDAWTVSCRDDGKSKKVCSATLPMVVQQQNQTGTVGAWIIAHNNEGALLSLLQTPQIDTGVMIAKGVALKIGDGKPHQFSYVACNPQRCESTMPMEGTVIKEMIAGANSPAAITFWKADGADVTFNIQSIKGIDKAIAAVR
jgi:invasion protein IalB